MSVHHLTFGNFMIPLGTMSRTNGLYGLMAVRLKIVETICTGPIMGLTVFSTGVRVLLLHSSISSPTGERGLRVQPISIERSLMEAS
jgi:hypothetical protein